MFCTTYRRRAFAAALFAAVVAACVAPALAIFPHQQTVLSGADINGQDPRGHADLSQAAQPHAPGRLVVHVRDVALPDGTRLNVIIDGKLEGNVIDDGQLVGVITLHGGVGNLSAPVGLQVGRLSSLHLALENRTVILSGATPWQVPWSM